MAGWTKERRKGVEGRAGQGQDRGRVEAGE